LISKDLDVILRLKWYRGASLLSHGLDSGSFLVNVLEILAFGK
jgi:hypothetical protein